LEKVFLAAEREMLRRWRKRVARSNEAVQYRLGHDDIVLSSTWEATATAINCSVTADVDSGYVIALILISISMSN
jgi:hypothetical protein